MRKTAKGTGYCTFCLAVNRSRKSADGAWEEFPNFFYLSLYGERAEKLLPYLVKGQAVSVDGYLKVDTWETPQGRRSRLEIGIDTLRFIGPSSKGGQDQGSGEAGPANTDDMMSFANMVDSEETDPDFDLDPGTGYNDMGQE
jgi:single-strand DNA-binding protein